jgi:hypothetical protein
MRLSVLLGLGVGLALASTSAYAFQEQQSGGVPAPAAPAAAPPAAQDKAMDLSSAPAAGSSSSAGTEVRIPGLGKLGVLPKMDFGLELLYGAAEQKRQDSPPEVAPTPDDDLMIRGTVKHRF